METDCPHSIGRQQWMVVQSMDSDRLNLLASVSSTVEWDLYLVEV